jgi:hypothetical protein
MNDEYLIYGETLKSIADSIRSVSSVSTSWTPDEMAAYVLANLVKPTTRQAAKTYTPSTSNQTIPAGTFLTGAATITGEPNYVEGNIRKGTKMWDKTGTLSGIWGVPDAFYGFTAVKSGSFTLNSAFSSDDYVITHGLGVLPRLVLYYTDSIVSSAQGSNARNAIMGMAFATTSESETTKVGSKYCLSSGLYYQFTAYKTSYNYPLFDQYYATTSDSYRSGYSNISIETMYSNAWLSREAYGIGTIHNCSPSSFYLRICYSNEVDGVIQSVYNGFGTKTWKWIVMG